MSGHRKNRRAYRPSVIDAKLEDRLVLAVSQSGVFLNVPGGGELLVPQIQAAASQGAQAAAQAARRSTVTAQQMRLAFLRQSRVALQDLRQFLSDQARVLFSNPTLTPQQLANFNAFMLGAVDATAFRLSSQAALLPGSSARLVPGIQNALLGPGGNSLINRLQALTFAEPNIASANALQAAIARQVNRATLFNNTMLNNFFRTTNLARLSLDQNNTPIPLSQFISGQIVNQFGNNLGLLAQALPLAANSMLFANGVTNPTQAAQLAFQNQLSQALGLATFQLGNNLALFPGTSAAVIPQLQTALFAPGSTSLLGALQGLPVTTTGFANAALGTFNNSFANLINPLNTAFNLPVQTPLTLPTGQISTVFGPQFSTFANGFNNGFGTGFIGFGPTTSQFNPLTSTGFFGLTTGLNPAFGFNPPVIGTGGVVPVF